MTSKFEVDSVYNEMRLDTYLSLVAEVSRSHAGKLLKYGCVTVNGKERDKAYLVKQGDVVDVELPEQVECDIPAEDIPINIVYQDSDVAVINKQQGLTVHPANNVYTGTLVNALLYHVKDLSGINGVLRPGIVHRLDKDTSGLMMVAKNDFAHNSLAAQIQTKECRRIYTALVEGVIKEDSGIVDKAIARSTADRKKMAVCNDGRNAVTLYTVMKRYRQNTLLRLELKTGRTHQIRVHCKYLGHPVVGDATYGYKNQRFKLDGQLLHASEIMFTHPRTGEQMHFTADLPDYFKRVLEILDKEQGVKL